MQVYIANPFIFSPATKEWYVNTMIPVVSKHAKVINTPGEVSFDDFPTHEEKSKAIFDWNVEHIDQADFLICVLDGVTTDDGTAWEVGYAWAQGKPAIAVRFDVRDGCKEKISRYTNLMIENCCVSFATTLEELDKALAEFVKGK